MKKKSKEKFIKFFKLLISSFALLSLLVAGAFSFEITLVDQSGDKADNRITNIATIEPSPGEASEASEGVSTDKERSKKTTAQLFAVVAVFGSTDKFKDIKVNSTEFSEIKYNLDEIKLAPPVSNIWTISDRLGRRFTLVGAKPDGTS